VVLDTGLMFPAKNEIRIARRHAEMQCSNSDHDGMASHLAVPVA